jgi:hypothetical protein
MTHFWMVGKVLLTEVTYWAVALTALLGFRVWWALRTRVRAHPATPDFDGKKSFP